LDGKPYRWSPRGGFVGCYIWMASHAGGFQGDIPETRLGCRTQPHSQPPSTTIQKKIPRMTDGHLSTLEVTQGQILSQSPTDEEVAFVWELTKETIDLPLGCRGKSCSSPHTNILCTTRCPKPGRRDAPNRSRTRARRSVEQVKFYTGPFCPALGQDRYVTTENTNGAFIADLL